jgi:hypothetical protein
MNFSHLRAAEPVSDNDTKPRNSFRRGASGHTSEILTIGPALTLMATYTSAGISPSLNQIPGPRRQLASLFEPLTQLFQL